MTVREWDYDEISCADAFSGDGDAGIAHQYHRQGGGEKLHKN